MIYTCARWGICRATRRRCWPTSNKAQVKSLCGDESRDPLGSISKPTHSFVLSYQHAAGTSGCGTTTAAEPIRWRRARAGNEDGGIHNRHVRRHYAGHRVQAHRPLLSQGLQILSADINTLVDGLVLDRFRVRDPDYADEPPPQRQQEIEHCLKESLISGQVPPFRRVWRAAGSKNAESLPGLPTQVRVDNSTSQQFTIIDVFASGPDGLVVCDHAHFCLNWGCRFRWRGISTHLDQSVDVFYVTDQNSRKIMDEARLEHIRRRRLQAIEKLEQESPFRYTDESWRRRRPS